MIKVNLSKIKKSSTMERKQKVSPARFGQKEIMMHGMQVLLFLLLFLLLLLVLLPTTTTTSVERERERESRQQTQPTGHIYFLPKQDKIQKIARVSSKSRFQDQF